MNEDEITSTIDKKEFIQFISVLSIVLVVIIIGAFSIADFIDKYDMKHPYINYDKTERFDSTKCSKFAICLANDITNDYSGWEMIYKEFSVGGIFGCYKNNKNTMQVICYDELFSSYSAKRVDVYTDSLGENRVNLNLHEQFLIYNAFKNVKDLKEAKQKIIDDSLQLIKNHIQDSLTIVQKNRLHDQFYKGCN